LKDPLSAYPLEVQPNDPASLVAAVLTLACATWLAGYVPARQSRIDPLAALRHE
jgi:hypothetical protein